MAPCAFSDGRMNTSLSVFIDIVKVFATEWLASKFGLFSLDINEFLVWAVQEKNAVLQEIAEVLQNRMPKPRAKNFVLKLAIRALPFLQKTSTEQARQFLRASAAVDRSAWSDVCLNDSFFWLLRGKLFCRLFLTAERFWKAL